MLVRSIERDFPGHEPLGTTDARTKTERPSFGSPGTHVLEGERLPYARTLPMRPSARVRRVRMPRNPSTWLSSRASHDADPVDARSGPSLGFCALARALLVRSLLLSMRTFFS